MENNRTVLKGFREGLPYIYVVFAQKDTDRAMKIIELLRGVGYNIYYGSGIAAGEHYSDEISARIAKSEAVVLIASDDASESQWLLGEIAFARVPGKPLLILQSPAENTAADFPASYSFTSIEALMAVLPQNTRHIAAPPPMPPMPPSGIFPPSAAGGAPTAAPPSIAEPVKEPDSIANFTDDDSSCECPPAPAESTQSNVRSKVRPQRIDKVDFSVVSPESVKPGNSSIIDIYMYTKKQRRVVDAAIKKAKEKAVEAARTSSGFSAKQGSRVTVVLSSDDAVISDREETLVWTGDALDFKFRFSLPDEYRKKQVDFCCSILFDGIHISRLYFSVKVNSAKTVAVKFVRKDNKKAFVSYCHKDKQRVVDQIVSIQKAAPKMRFWMDNQSMAAGDQWRPAIASAIKSSDVFLLFWSVNARASSEVRKEWEYALLLEQTAKRRKNGSRFISPVPLDNPGSCPPPEELSDLHFGDPSFDRHIEHIDEINFIRKAK